MLGLLFQLNDSLMQDVMKAIRQHVDKVKEYNKDPTTTWRMLRPDDIVIGGTEGNYSTTIKASTTTQVCLTTTITAKTVPTAQGIFQIGWYLNGDITSTGNLVTKINGIKRNELPGDIITDQEEKWMLTPRQFVLAKENDKVIFQITSGAGVDIAAIGFPIAAIIGPAEQLGLQV